MKLKALFLSLLVTGALAQTSSEDDHEDLCAEEDQQEDGTLPGLKFKTCYVGTGSGDNEAKERRWYLYMKKLTPPPPPTTENPSEEGSNTGAGGLCDLCNQLEQSNAQLEECKRTKADCEKKLEQCLKDKEGLQSSQGTGGSGLPECPQSHNTHFTSPNGKKFKINCEQVGNFASLKKFDSKGFARCVDECAYYHNWKAVNYIHTGTGKGTCNLFQLSATNSGTWRPSAEQASAILIEALR
ncbi:hypothetical protein PENSUB_13050 [Penicillium subrubescens]|uniref:Apple domain-containing protein n=1 Tax=Penicillium subrubescens TaxID=1316194 RepID=A0A1Q5SUH9_9EURO|nr:hypothetical protein PENSUB_13050 [Penicillium subrubescens]